MQNLATGENENREECEEQKCYYLRQEERQGGEKSVVYESYW